MKLEDFGEDALVEKIRLMAGSPGEGVVEGIGDDAAVLEKDGDEFLLAAADMFIQGVHFLPEFGFFNIGHKAMGASLSDIAAMGGRAEYAVTSAAFEPGTSTTDAEALFEGLLSQAGEHGVRLVGGDTARSLAGLVIDVCVIGKVTRGNLCLRSGAKPGDVLFITGTLGNSGIALRRKEYFPVRPRLKEAAVLLGITKPSAMLDLSDGLAKDIKRLCGSSNCGAEICPGKIPAAKGADFKQAVSDGEDFELLFTAPAGEEEKILSEFPLKTGLGISAAGRIIPAEEGIFIRGANGEKIALEGGYEHFHP